LYDMKNMTTATTAGTAQVELKQGRGVRLPKLGLMQVELKDERVWKPCSERRSDPAAQRRKHADLPILPRGSDES